MDLGSSSHALQEVRARVRVLLARHRHLGDEARPLEVNQDALNRVVESRWPGPGALPRCTGTGPLTKQGCFVLLDFALGMAPDLGYAKANINNLGARVRRTYEGR